ncbi:aminoacyl-tRNA hydrolase [Halanaerobium sp.]|uniref:aminoacyl-tRNA hydrolase n=1 Tax=Halanaerobium sp. TaxID=1895664 RepID=UPI000DE6133E|nr:aminoacyl-tRNA hydrolase [Halanaerobium sp.]PUU89754.1 MAG: peptidyl-tRNA hydrolase, PTH1 family [Halanaerobium sp.]
MKVIAGLGNPGEKYAKTRHNIGFMVISELADRFKVKSSYKFDGLVGDFFFGGEKVILFQPMKYMNKSGQPIYRLLDYFEIEAEDLLVIHDDLDLDLGKMRFKQNGGSGGHNGIKSIINNLSTDEFNRLKIGIGRPPENIPVPDFVLTTFAGEEEDISKKVVADAVSAVELMLKEDIMKAMNKYNG